MLIINIIFLVILNQVIKPSFTLIIFLYPLLFHVSFLKVLSLSSNFTSILRLKDGSPYEIFKVRDAGSFDHSWSLISRLVSALSPHENLHCDFSCKFLLSHKSLSTKPWLSVGGLRTHVLLASGSINVAAPGVQSRDFYMLIWTVCHNLLLINLVVSLCPENGYSH